MNETIKNSSGETIDHTFAKGSHRSERSDWIVVLGHGVTGNKGRPIIVDTANALNVAGFDTLRFSFTGNGESEGRFVDSTVSKEIGDLDGILGSVSEKYTKICYIGHSMGAAVGVICAAGDTRINALVSLAGMVDTKTFAENEFGEEIPDSGLMWEDDDCPLSSVFMKDLCDTIGSVEPLVEAIETPSLLNLVAADLRAATERRSRSATLKRMTARLASA